MSPSPFIVEWLERIARERGPSTRLGAGADLRALDVAMGRGRHALPLARAGFRTFGVDVNLKAVRAAMTEAQREGVRIEGWCADLTQHPLPRGRFALVVVSRYLQRDLFPPLQAALAPAGVVVYETFTTHQRALGRPPTSADHLLEPGELRRRIEGLELLFYEEVLAPDAVARLVARSRS
jgi:2-polyprenyl-3-methyl-5-hydroxy-6-metoxy-1,4-benzoquinol methylase